jgi:hypothetical protein
MATLQIENFGDLVRTTQNELGEPNFTNIMSTLRGFPGAKNLLKKNQMKVQAGPQIQWNVAIDHNHQAENVAITDHDMIGQRDGQVQAKINWRKTKTGYSFYTEQMLVNRKPRQIVDLIAFNRAQAMTSWVEVMEANIWNFPLAADTRTPLGIPYWVPKSATADTTNNGFNGGIPSGYSDVANLSPTTYQAWKAYAGPFTNVTNDDLIRKARKMARQTQFKPAVENLPTFDKGEQRKYYTNDTVYGTLEEVLDAKNDNHGNELAKYDTGGVYFRRAEVENVPQLDADTTLPFYQIDWGVFGVVVLAGMWAKETTWSPYPGQRNVTAVFMDYVYNLICRDRRKLGILSTGTSYP